jgi:hypothetical protein
MINSPVGDLASTCVTTSDDEAVKATVANTAVSTVMNT